MHSSMTAELKITAAPTTTRRIVIMVSIDRHQCVNILYDSKPGTAFTIL